MIKKQSDRDHTRWYSNPAIGQVSISMFKAHSLDIGCWIFSTYCWNQWYFGGLIILFTVLLFWLGHELPGDLGQDNREVGDRHHGASQGGPPGHDTSKEAPAEAPASQCPNRIDGNSLWFCSYERNVLFRQHSQRPQIFCLKNEVPWHLIFKWGLRARVPHL